jgi:hypothetical protein
MVDSFFLLAGLDTVGKAPISITEISIGGFILSFLFENMRDLLINIMLI